MRKRKNNGRWFDRKKTILYWEGKNKVDSRERLYRLEGGRWILRNSLWNTKGHETYTPITKLQAAEWFMQNDFIVPDELSPQVQSPEIV